MGHHHYDTFGDEVNKPPGSPWQDEHTVYDTGKWRDLVFGITDGLICNYCTMLGVVVITGGNSNWVFLLCFISCIAQGCAKAGNDWASTTLQNEADDRELNTEKEHLMSHYEEEEAHMTKLLTEWGFLSDTTISLINEDCKRDPLRLHSKVELGLDLDKPKISPIKVSLSSLFYFSLGSFVSVLPWIPQWPSSVAFAINTFLVYLSLFIIGKFNGNFTPKYFKRSRTLYRQLVVSTVFFAVVGVASFFFKLISNSV
eukprot:TRINITY_DN27546_c0_g1_i1.p1 TRINITY_DN27546_c0_g1~~TRINITY_DN27546_c0_g1_i1.p1  ORF type:complete len:256 (+),score=54.80 TRINITY_DN27546_c0_g1_i1:49-816(+)